MVVVVWYTRNIISLDFSHTNIFIHYIPTFLCLPQAIEFKEECLHLHKDTCISNINARVLETPAAFKNPHLNFEINKIRERSDDGYNLVSLRLNMDGETVGGLMGDGMIWYPYQWCLTAENCITIGPWGEFIF